MLPRLSESPSRTWHSVLAVIAVVGAIGLLNHHHRAHPMMDLVNVQHKLLAATTTAQKIFVSRSHYPVGIQLAAYIE